MEIGKSRQQCKNGVKEIVDTSQHKKEKDIHTYYKRTLTQLYVRPGL